MPRQPSTPWPTAPGSVFFGDVASAATLSRAVKDGRIRPGTRLARSQGGRLLAARASGHEYDPDRVERFDQLARFLTMILPELDVPAELPALPDDHRTSLPFFEAYFSNFIEGTAFSIEEAESIVDSTDAERSGVRLELP